MKEFKTIKKQYSVFGNFNSYIENIDELSNLFPAFTKNEEKEQLRTKDNQNLYLKKK